MDSTLEFDPTLLPVSLVIEPEIDDEPQWDSMALRIEAFQTWLKVREQKLVDAYQERGVVAGVMYEAFMAGWVIGKRRSK